MFQRQGLEAGARSDSAGNQARADEPDRPRLDRKAKAKSVSSAGLGLAVVLAAAPVSLPARAAQDAPRPSTGRDLSALHDFDFLLGDWVTHHRRLRTRFVRNAQWVEFEGTVSERPLMGGFGNFGDNLFNVPGGAYRGVGLRSYDARTGLWSIWWLDGRDPSGALDPPIRGRFDHGVGRFYSNDTLNGRPIRVRVTWTRPTPNTAHWEQAFSADGGKTWEINWTTDFRHPAKPADNRS